ncbi:hypothetical protein AGMMS49992_29820 [Clostridia bacterium]|nr:hypothetical protein AGMMS49992_29820 [Clostridia bacterium]
MASSTERARQFERYPTYKTAYIHAFDRMIATGKARAWKDGEDCMCWWLRDARVKGRPLIGQVAIEFGDEGDLGDE